jgi:hypothetical protein
MQTFRVFCPRGLLFKTTFLVAIFDLILVLSARAACPHPTPAPNAEFFKAYSVIVGTAISEKTDLNPYDGSLIEGWFYSLRIEKTFRGSPQKFMRVYTENTNGRFPLKVGERYLLFVYREEGRLTINGCGNSAPLSEATAAITAIKAIKHAGPYGEIQGRVQKKLEGDGVAGVRIVARSGKNRFSTVSGEDGWFQMRVPPGTYELTASSSAFIIVPDESGLSYDDADRFVVHRGSSAHFEFFASPK